MAGIAAIAFVVMFFAFVVLPSVLMKRREGLAEETGD